MTRLDRYILQQLVAASGFFVLVFTGVIWLTQAVRLIDTVVASGQSASIFLEFSALVLPQVFVIVLPSRAWARPSTRSTSSTPTASSS